VCHLGAQYFLRRENTQNYAEIAPGGLRRNAITFAPRSHAVTLWKDDATGAAAVKQGGLFFLNAAGERIPKTSR
jgi:hypothetical protein